MQMIPVRLFFQKLGRVKYTSHLDTMRTMTRAFRRSKLPFWYTQGFNPHLYMTFALPISLGFESLCESVDLRLTEEVPLKVVEERLAASLPPGFEVVRVTTPEMDPEEIVWAVYDIGLRYREGDTARLQRQMETFLNQPVIEVKKRTKKGEKSVDLRPMMQMLDMRSEPTLLELTLRLSAGNNDNINPTLPLKAFYDWSEQTPDGVKVMRTHILTKHMVDFA